MNVLAYADSERHEGTKRQEEKMEGNISETDEYGHQGGEGWRMDRWTIKSERDLNKGEKEANVTWNKVE